MTEQRMLHATLCEVERGLFHVAYRIEGQGLSQHHLPLYQVGTSAPDARLRIEQHARECGYGPIVWDEEVSGPPMRLPPEHQSARLSR